MIQLYKRIHRMREKYVDTIAKLYEYATTVYTKKQYTQWFDTKEGGYTYAIIRSIWTNRQKNKNSENA